MQINAWEGSTMRKSCNKSTHAKTFMQRLIMLKSHSVIVTLFDVCPYVVSH